MVCYRKKSSLLRILWMSGMEWHQHTPVACKMHLTSWTFISHSIPIIYYHLSFHYILCKQAFLKPDFITDPILPLNIYLYTVRYRELSELDLNGVFFSMDLATFHEKHSDLIQWMIAHTDFMYRNKLVWIGQFDAVGIAIVPNVRPNNT